uniref:Uncharacterized protein n=1 Tax=Panagrolaimus superbus TaxID=310955 RepID=A0A914YGK3_9BILA
MPSPIRPDRPRAPNPDRSRFPRARNPSVNLAPRAPIGNVVVRAAPENAVIADASLINRRDYALTVEEYNRSRPELLPQHLDQRAGQTRFFAAGQAALVQ